MEPWMIWVGIGVICMIIEIFTPGFLFMSFGIGAILTGLVSIVVRGTAIQILIFAVITFILLFLRKFSKKFISESSEETNIFALIMNNKLTISIILMIIGIIAIIISQTVSFTTVRNYPPFLETNNELKNAILYCGIGFLLIGGIILAISFRRTKFIKKEDIAEIEGKNKILFCPNCGTKLEGDNKFCSECGTPL